MDDDYKYTLMIPVEAPKFLGIILSVVLLIFFNSAVFQLYSITELRYDQTLNGTLTFLVPFLVMNFLFIQFLMISVYITLYRDYDVLIDRSGVSVNPRMYRYLIPYKSIKSYEVSEIGSRGGTIYSFYINLKFRARSISHPIGTTRLFLFAGHYHDEAARLLDHYLASRPR